MSAADSARRGSTCRGSTAADQVANREAGARSLADLDAARVLVSCDYERQLVEARLLADGIVPAGYSRFDDNGLIQALAAAGEGIAVVPRLTVDVDDPRVAVHDLPDCPRASWSRYGTATVIWGRRRARSWTRPRRSAGWVT